MSTKDLWIRDVVAHYGLLICALFCAVFWINRKWPRLRELNYRYHLLGFEMDCAELALPYKKHLFKSLQHIISNDEVLRSMGCIRLLEIGVKTGENIQFYPEGTHLIGVDWNLRLGEYLVKSNRSWQFSHIIIERLIIGDGSSLKEIPTESVDVVVTTRSLCSVRSARSTLNEIQRVLAPGGSYFFMEHVPEENGTLLKWLQKALTRTGVWPSLFGDCRLDRNLIKELENTDFEKITWTSVTLKGTSQSFHLMLSGRHVFGAAIR